MTRQASASPLLLCCLLLRSSICVTTYDIRESSDQRDPVFTYGTSDGTSMTVGHSILHALSKEIQSQPSQGEGSAGLGLFLPSRQNFSSLESSLLDSPDEMFHK